MRSPWITALNVCGSVHITRATPAPPSPTITDIQVEGVSFASAQRADLTAYLQQHNGSIPELVKNLNALTERLARKGEPLSTGY